MKHKTRNILLFLDFDGVTHPNSGSAPFKQENMFWLEKALTEFPQINIVISSSWRETKPLNEIKQLLGHIAGSRVIGITPVIDDPFLHAIRYYEVIKYLEETDNIDTLWFALDDTPGFYKGNGTVIYTDPHTGLSESDYVKIRDLIHGLKT